MKLYSYPACPNSPTPIKRQVDESKRSSSGGGLVDHGELIEVLRVPLDNTGAFLMDPSLNSSPGLMYGLLWARDEINAGRVSKMYGLPKTTQEEGTEKKTAWTSCLCCL